MLSLKDKSFLTVDARRSIARASVDGNRDSAPDMGGVDIA